MNSQRSSPAHAIPGEGVELFAHRVKTVLVREHFDGLADDLPPDPGNAHALQPLLQSGDVVIAGFMRRVRSRLTVRDVRPRLGDERMLPHLIKGIAPASCSSPRSAMRTLSRSGILGRDRRGAGDRRQAGHPPGGGGGGGFLALCACV